jgi:mannose-6-phosphate isomerase-like protein (cupin superfamily)
MAHAGQIIDNPVTGERIEFTKCAADTDGELLAFELTLDPDGHVPGAHVHPSQEERFEIVSGTMKFRMNGKKIVAGPGDVVTVPAGARHKFANGGDVPVEVRVEVVRGLRERTRRRSTATRREERARRRVEKGERTELFELMEAKGRTRLTSGVWARALERGDKLAAELVDDAIAALGAGVASACNVLDVECVVVGGGLGVRLGEPFAERIAEAMRPHLFFEQMPAVRTAALGDLGGAIGAALLARD